MGFCTSSCGHCEYSFFCRAWLHILRDPHLFSYLARLLCPTLRSVVVALRGHVLVPRGDVPSPCGDCQCTSYPRGVVVFFMIGIMKGRVLQCFCLRACHRLQQPHQGPRVPLLMLRRLIAASQCAPRTRSSLSSRIEGGIG